MAQFFFMVMGAGIAGASGGCALSAASRILVLELEERPGYHSTGRSAALYAETYGNRTVRGLTTAGKAFYLDPPAGFTEHPLLRPRGVMLIGRADQEASLAGFLAEVAGLRSNIRRIDPAEAYRRSPVL